MSTTRSWNLKAASRKCLSSSNAMFRCDLAALGNEETLLIYRRACYERIPAGWRRIFSLLVFTAVFYGCSFPI